MMSNTVSDGSDAADAIFEPVLVRVVKALDEQERYLRLCHRMQGEVCLADVEVAFNRIRAVWTGSAEEFSDAD